MELIEGETLEAGVRRAGGLPVDTVLEIGAQAPMPWGRLRPAG